MKNVIILVALASLFIGSLAVGDTKLNKIHKGMETNGKKVNCLYCHKNTNIPKKGTDYHKYYKTPTCAIAKCHLKGS